MTTVHSALPMSPAKTLLAASGLGAGTAAMAAGVAARAASSAAAGMFAIVSVLCSIVEVSPGQSPPSRQDREGVRVAVPPLSSQPARAVRHGPPDRRTGLAARDQEVDHQP